MAIHKASASKVRSFGLHYTTVTNEVMAQIQNPDSMAIWSYLLSKSDDWTPREADIMARWGFGRDRYLKAMRHLRDLGLVWTHTERDGGGKIVDRVINVGSMPLEWVEAISDLTISRVSLRKVEPIVGESDPLLIYRSNTNLSIQTKFDEFYTHYPKKQGKADGQKAWNSTIKTFEQAERAIEHVQTRPWPDDKKYIPLPGTFIRGKRWEDDLDTAPQSQGAYL